LHTLRAKKDPVELIKRHAGRSKSVHLRDYADLKGALNDQPDFGRGNCPWIEVFKACETVGGTEWFIIERFGAAPPKDLEWAAQAIGFLRSHGRGKPA
jgi:sugar phosphate isomerase/epimerase